jgi:hypothetical protein
VVAVLGEPTLLGSQEPRIVVVPEGDDHPKWQEVVEFIAALGVVLDPWQMVVLRVALRRLGAVWAAFAVAVCAPRQNGKNGILEIRELIGPLVLGEKLLIHTAHLADTSKEGFRRLDDLIDANAWLSAQVKHIWRTNGHESIEFLDGRRIRFRTRTRGGGRGFSGSPVFFDEAMFLPEVSMGSILPVISAQPDPQIWYMGSAVDQAIMEDGVVFARVRARALSGDHERLAYFEWSLDAESPDLVEIELPRDLALLAAANPAFGIRIKPDYLEAEWRELDPRTHAVERGGVGDWPPVDGTAGQVIPLARWDELADDPVAEGARMLDPVWLAFDVTPDRSMSAIVAVGRRADGLAQIEVADHRVGTAWVPERLAELQTRHDVESVVCDAAGPAGSLLHLCENAGITAEPVSGSDYAKAFGAFLDAVDDSKLRHLGGQDLRAAVRGASKRPLGAGAFAWGRRNSTVDISPLVAATLALFAASNGSDWDSDADYVLDTRLTAA